MGEQKHITAEYIRSLGPKLHDTVADDFAAAGEILPDLKEVEAPNFTTVVPTMAAVYAVATEFVEAQLKRQFEHLVDIKDNLKANAEKWAQTENENTAKGA